MTCSIGRPANVDASLPVAAEPLDATVAAYWCISSCCNLCASCRLGLLVSPPARLFSSGRVSIGGTTIENTGADLAEIATIQLRTEGTKPGEAAGGAAGLLVAVCIDTGFFWLV